MNKNKTLTELFYNYKMPKSSDIARKMLGDINKLSREDVGKAILSTKKPTQTIINLQVRQ